MPCACRLPIELYPDATEWGPLLWTVLHSLAERAGSPVTPLYIEDERRLWMQLFSRTADIIPCPSCKEHFTEYLKEHPVTELKTLSHTQFYEWIRTWFWEVHEWVNHSLKKPSYPKDQLAAKYKPIRPHPVVNALQNPMKRAIMLSGQQMKKWIEWKGTVGQLCSVLGA